MDRSHFEVVADVDLRHWWFLGRRKILRDTVACLVPPDRSATIIDVGCGTGANIASLSDRYSCVGIDTSPDAIAAARERFAGVHFIVGRAPQDLGGLASRADLILLMDVIEHAPDDRAVLEPIVAAMHPGAFLLITVPADMRLWSSHDEGLLHYRRYDPDMLQQAWSGLPVSLVGLTHFCSRLYPLARVERQIGRVVERISPKTKWEMKVPAAPLNRLLEQAFAGEANTVVETIRQRRRNGYRRGVSLMAVLERRPGVEV